MTEQLRQREASRLLETAEIGGSALTDMALLVASLCDAPYSIINLIGETHANAVATYGLELVKLERCDSFCNNVVTGASYVEVFDLKLAERYSASPFVTSSPHARFYAGIPLITDNGLIVGAIGVLDIKPRALSEKQRTDLHRVARAVVGLLESNFAVRKLEESQSALTHEREFLNAVLENLAEGVVACNPDGHLTLFNKSSRVMHGLDANSELRSDQWAEYYSLFEADGSTPLKHENIPLLRVLRGEKLRDSSMVLKSRGEASLISCNGQPIVSPEGRTLGAVVTLADITQLKSNEQKILESNVALKRATEAKSEFVANMSHEIRTPLNGIIGISELLLGSELTLEQADQLQLVQSSAKNLLAIVNDVLDFSKIEAGKLEFEEVDFDFRDLVAHVLKTFTLSAQTKAVELKLSDRAESALVFRADSGRIRQVLSNLISNALKFTEAGEVEVLIESRPSQIQSCSKLRIEVRDSGIGIAPEKLERLFKAFSQADSSTTRRFGGTGLGLNISKRIIELMNGSIGVHSTEGVGSVFWFEIDLKTSCLDRDDQAFVKIDHSLSFSEASHLRVLVAEDNSVNRKVVTGMLNKLGIQPVVVEDGHLAVATAAEEAFDIILMDCQMPIMDGYEATRLIRNQACGVKLPVRIVALTAHAMSGDRERCLAAGMDDYLSKPFSLDALRKVIEASVSLTRSSALVS